MVYTARAWEGLANLKQSCKRRRRTWLPHTATCTPTLDMYEHVHVHMNAVLGPP